MGNFRHGLTLDEAASRDSGNNSIQTQNLCHPWFCLLCGHFSFWLVLGFPGNLTFPILLNQMQREKSFSVQELEKKSRKVGALFSLDGPSGTHLQILLFFSAFTRLFLNFRSFSFYVPSLLGTSYTCMGSFNKI